MAYVYLGWKVVVEHVDGSISEIKGPGLLGGHIFQSREQAEEIAKESAKLKGVKQATVVFSGL